MSEQTSNPSQGAHANQLGPELEATPAAEHKCIPGAEHQIPGNQITERPAAYGPRVTMPLDVVADPAPVNLWQADWPYPELGPAQFSALYTAAADIIKARGYYEYEIQGYADEPGISVCGALKLAALEAEQAAAPLDPIEARYSDAVCVAEELETRLSAVLYVLGQLHTRTGIRDLSDQLAGWELGHFYTGPNPGRDKALALLGHAAAMFGHLAETTSPVTTAPEA